MIAVSLDFGTRLLMLFITSMVIRKLTIVEMLNELLGLQEVGSRMSIEVHCIHSTVASSQEPW